MLSVVILTLDEERHIRRAIASVAGLADRIYVVDSGSTDSTVALARAHGAQVMSHPFVTQAQQFNWALDQLPADTDWVLRLDADEVLSDPLAAQIRAGLARFGPEVSGVIVSRRMCFLGRPIRWGGLFPVRILRLFRHGRGRCENRWMDEHIVVEGQIETLSGEILDDNLNSLTWWTDKHNSYASREVVDILNREHGMIGQDNTGAAGHGQQAAGKRWLKERVYARLPGGIRALGYFLYRYVFRLGFLDGKEGAAFHVLQGFWYRFLVDTKLHEVRHFMATREADASTAIREVLGITIPHPDTIPRPGDAQTPRADPGSGPAPPATPPGGPAEMGNFHKQIQCSNLKKKNPGTL